MSGNSFGTLFKITTFGESHGPAIGVVIDGCPVGIEITADFIQKFLNERRPGNNPYTSKRKEADIVEILSGVYLGKTLGTPIALLIRNIDAKPEDYNNLQHTFRPSHADYTWYNKYKHVDHRGGGRTSARETAARVAASAVAAKILEHYNIEVIGFLSAIGNSKIDNNNIDYSHLSQEAITNNIFFTINEEMTKKWQKKVESAIESGDSWGSRVTIVIKNAPLGLGGPVFDKLNAELAKAIFSIPAVKSLEFSDAETITSGKGSTNNDQIAYENGKVKFLSNNSSGIQGGISNGEDIIMHIGIKPTSSISLTQNTINSTNEAVKLEVKGRHDPVIGIRAVPVCRAMCTLVIADHLLRAKLVHLS